MIIAIDGPAGSGKSTTARLVAQKLGFQHLDTGAMYRCITHKALQQKISYKEADKLGQMSVNTQIEFMRGTKGQQVFMDGTDVTEAIRLQEVTAHVSDYCAVPVVRTILVDQQRKMGTAANAVLEGRDIGTVVFPRADYKIYLVAGIKERAHRRQKEYAQKGVQVDLQDLVKEIEERDRKDSTRKTSPLKKADDAIEIDTTNMTIAEQVEAIVSIVHSGKTPK